MGTITATSLKHKFKKMQGTLSGIERCNMVFSVEELIYFVRRLEKTI
jgi:hypothetical protein